jgi:hypothetical protein
MKWLIGLALAAFGLGVWAASRADGSALIETRFQTGIAIFLGCNLLFGIWVWWRAKPGSGDRMLMPTNSLMTAAMLIGILPRLFWPAAQSAHIAATIVSLGVMAVTVIVQHRRRKRIRQGGPTT